MTRSTTKLTAGKYKESELAEIKRSVSILEVCAVHHIRLSPHGTNDKKGCCPFHEEKKPSFIVSPAKNLWHCMGCDKGGSVIDLVMQLENLTFKETIDKLRITTRHINRARTATGKAKQLNEKIRMRNHGGTGMSEQQFSSITIKALMRLYKIGLKQNPDGSCSGSLPWSVCLDAKLMLSTSGGIWWIEGGGLSASEPTQAVGDRLDFIMRVECVSRERASEMLYTVYPSLLKRDCITKEGLDYATHIRK